MTEVMEGGCACGAVRYRLDSLPMFVHCCHCRDCQRQTGSAFVINALIETSRIAILSGDPEPVAVPTDSGKPHRSYRLPRLPDRGAELRTAAARPSASSGSARSTTLRHSAPTCISTSARNCPGSASPRASRRLTPITMRASCGRPPAWNADAQFSADPPCCGAARRIGSAQRDLETTLCAGAGHHGFVPALDVGEVGQVDLVPLMPPSPAEDCEIRDRNVAAGEPGHRRAGDRARRRGGASPSEYRSRP